MLFQLYVWLPHKRCKCKYVVSIICMCNAVILNSHYADTWLDWLIYNGQSTAQS